MVQLRWLSVLAVLALVLFFTALIPQADACGNPYGCVYKPDLKMMSAEHGTGSTQYVWYTHKNVGSAHSGPFKVTMYKVIPTAGRPILEVYKVYHYPDGFAPGEEATAMYTKPCGHDHYIVIDSGNQVIEIDETNNTATIQRTCSNIPPRLP